MARQVRPPMCDLVVLSAGIVNVGVHDVKHVSYNHVLCGEESDICADGKYVCYIRWCGWQVCVHVE